MSIYRQLWFAIIGLTVLAFAGSFVLSVYTARNYIEQQLFLKNTDNAASLALVLSQLPDKDPITVELLISSQFDTGHYQEIQLTDPKHQLLLERHYSGNDDSAPAWFIRLFPIQAKAGVALVQDGWKQYGAIKVVSHSRFAYRELWQGALRLTGWFALAGLCAGFIGTLLLRFLCGPLNRVVEQANAIQDRHFITVDEPRIPELRSRVIAMNSMVLRLKAMFSEEALRLDELRRQVNHDSLTDLPNRTFFITWLEERLHDEHGPSAGTLTIVRIADLDRINTHLGHAHTDKLIKDIGQVLTRLASHRMTCLAARLNGSDFALAVAGDLDAEAIAGETRDALKREVLDRWAQLTEIFHVGSIAFSARENTGDLLAAADNALAMAESQGPNSAYHLATTQETGHILSSDAWRHTLNDVIGNERIRLQRYPVLAAAGELLHDECAARIQPEVAGTWISAGEFMPMAMRLKLSANLDMTIIRIALNSLEPEGADMAINISAESVNDWGFCDDLIKLLSREPAKCRKLWLEVPEYGAFRFFDAYRSLCHSLDPLGCKLGIEHFGEHFGEIAKLAELGLDYLKVDSSYIRGIEQHAGNQEFLAGLCKMAHAVGVKVIAEGVQSEQEFTTLIKLGFDAATGQGITLMMK